MLVQNIQRFKIKNCEFVLLDFTLFQIESLNNEEISCLKPSNIKNINFSGFYNTVLFKILPIYSKLKANCII